MTRDLSKAIVIKSKANNQYVKWPSKENYLTFQKKLNISVLP